MTEEKSYFWEDLRLFLVMVTGYTILMAGPTLVVIYVIHLIKG